MNSDMRDQRRPSACIQARHPNTEFTYCDADPRPVRALAGLVFGATIGFGLGTLIRRPLAGAAFGAASGVAIGLMAPTIEEIASEALINSRPWIIQPRRPILDFNAQ